MALPREIPVSVRHLIASSGESAVFSKPNRLSDFVLKNKYISFLRPGFTPEQSRKLEENPHWEPAEQTNRIGKAAAMVRHIESNSK